MATADLVFPVYFSGHWFKIDTSRYLHGTALGFRMLWIQDILGLFNRATRFLRD